MQVQLWWPDESVDDHERPRHRLWRWYHYPESAKELIVTQDGDVLEADTLYVEDMLYGTAVRHRQVLEADSFVAQALAAAGYELRSVS
jgi:hypothetical protein